MVDSAVVHRIPRISVITAVLNDRGRFAMTAQSLLQHVGLVADHAAPDLQPA